MWYKHLFSCTEMTLKKRKSNVKQTSHHYGWCDGQNGRFVPPQSLEAFSFSGGLNSDTPTERFLSTCEGQALRLSSATDPDASSRCSPPPVNWRALECPYFCCNFSHRPPVPTPGLSAQKTFSWGFVLRARAGVCCECKAGVVSHQVNILWLAAGF